MDRRPVPPAEHEVDEVHEGAAGAARPRGSRASRRSRSSGGAPGPRGTASPATGSRRRPGRTREPRRCRSIRARAWTSGLPVGAPRRLDLPAVDEHVRDRRRSTRYTRPGSPNANTAGRRHRRHVEPVDARAPSGPRPSPGPCSWRSSRSAGRSPRRDARRSASQDQDGVGHAALPARARRRPGPRRLARRPGHALAEERRHRPREPPGGGGSGRGRRSPRRWRGETWRRSAASARRSSSTRMSRPISRWRDVRSASSAGSSGPRSPSRASASGSPVMATRPLAAGLRPREHVARRVEGRAVALRRGPGARLHDDRRRSPSAGHARLGVERRAEHGAERVDAGGEQALDLVALGEADGREPLRRG